MAFGWIASTSALGFVVSNHGVQCLLVTLRMLVVPLSGSFQRSSLMSTGLPLASSLGARFLMASNSAFDGDGIPNVAVYAARIQ